MSGIVGILNLDGSPVDNSLLSRLTDYLTFRGPDAQGTWGLGPVGLGHTLLRTVDDTRPDSQPFSLDGEVVITADARIDGRPELRQKLSSHGCHDLEDIPDVELILHAYLVWGDECAKHLLGDFAFAIWDGRRRQLFCARDHFGVKPFYYAQVGNCLIFSNTLNCVRMHPQVSDRLNDLAIGDFLLFDFNQDQSTTTFADIRRLPPAHYLTWQQGTLRPGRYWSLPLVDRPLRYSRPQDYVEHFKALLTQAVADRLRTRQVGVSMSGGLDSSTVAALARRKLADRFDSFGLQAHTGVYERLIPDEERRYAGLVAKYLDIPIHYLTVDDYSLYQGFDEELHWPEPYHNPTAAIWSNLVRQMGRYGRVILTGEGGDPVLSQSKSYIYALFKSLHLLSLAVEMGRCVLLYGRLPQVGFRSSLRQWGDGHANHEALPSWLNPAFAARCDLQGRWARFRLPSGPNHPLRQEAYHSLRHPLWPYGFELEYDAGALEAPVEFRHPFFDVRLVTFALALPPLPWCVDKTLLREAGRGLLPEAVRRRPKSPLAADPVLELVRQRQAHGMDQLVPHPGLSAYVDISALSRLSQVDDSQNLWINLRPLTLNYWLQQQPGMAKIFD